MVVVAYPVALMLLALACAFLLATNKTYQYSFGVLLAKLANLFRAVRIGIPHVGHIGLGAVGDAIDGVNNFILAKIGEGIDATSHALVWLWAQMTHLFTELGQALGDLADSTERALSVLVHTTIPRLVREAGSYATRPLEAAVARLRSAIAAVEAEAAQRLASARRAAEAAVGQTLAMMHALEHRLARSMDAALTWPRAKIGELERGYSRVWERIRSHQRLLTVAGLTALTTAVLGRLGLGWTRCSKVGRVGKALCGMDEGLLESLLVGSMVVAGSISVVELARECQSFTGEVDDALRFFLRELR